MAQTVILYLGVGGRVEHGGSVHCQTGASLCSPDSWEFSSV